ncbi:hypothetical protein CHS0354_001308 [Potamilus streckersoni]|uniref:Parvovirus non-structural protein 1 helicase domain-containing protein n=1 Tax=Potamilus streckersoni TaxID=2493646 RepID=A0AAE0RV84_9BIVA|nr:hypothetical protein CHS0354_001308 [Potamilus streckersoni]
MMVKYQKTDIFKIIREVTLKGNDDDAADLLDNLGRGSQARILVQNAARLLCSWDPRTYSEIFMEETTEQNVLEQFGDTVLSVTETHDLLNQWSKEKRGAIKSGTYYLLAMYGVVFRKVPKCNTFMCVGAPGSGKTYWTDPVLWLNQYVGQSVNGSHFCFAELAHSKIGLINELRFNRDTLDSFKQIAENRDCMVAVKNNGMGDYDNQPIIVTVNTEPWTAISEGKDAINGNRYMSEMYTVKLVDYEDSDDEEQQEPDSTVGLCELCGFQGICNGGANGQMYAMHKAELDEILDQIETAEVSEEPECFGEIITIRFG